MSLNTINHYFELDSKEVKVDNDDENTTQEVTEEVDSDDEELINESPIQDNDEDRLLQQAIFDSFEKK